MDSCHLIRRSGLVQSIINFFRTKIEPNLYTKLLEEGTLAIKEMLGQSSFKKLYLGNLQLGARGLEQLVSALNSSKLEILHIDNNKLGDLKSMRFLAKLINELT
jgi:hypothetical protein